MSFILTATLALSTLSVGNTTKAFDEETLAPTSEQIGIGTQNSGGNLASWGANDGDLRKICKFFVPNDDGGFIRLRLNFVATILNPTAIRFKVRISSKSGGNQRIRLRIYNMFTNARIDLDGGNMMIVTVPTDIEGIVPGSLKDYIDPTGKMSCHIEVWKIGFSSVAFPCTSFDSGNLIVSN